MLFNCDLDIPDDYSDDDLLNLLCHIAKAITEGKKIEEIVAYDGRPVGTWEIL